MLEGYEMEDVEKYCFDLITKSQEKDFILYCYGILAFSELHLNNNKPKRESERDQLFLPSRSDQFTYTSYLFLYISSKYLPIFIQEAAMAFYR
jgi:hypothetical protein